MNPEAYFKYDLYIGFILIHVEIPELHLLSLLKYVDSIGNESLIFGEYTSTISRVLDELNVAGVKGNQFR